MDVLLNKIILKSKNEYKEYNFSKLSDYKKVLMLKLLLNFTQTNNIEQFPEIRKVLKVGNNAKMNIKDYKFLVSHYTKW